MKKTVFAKCASYRSPKYRLVTCIVKEEESLFVEKHPLGTAACAHIKTIGENCEKLKGVYPNVKLVDYEYIGDGIRFPFIKGEPLDSDIDYVHEPVEIIKEKLSKIADIILETDSDFVNIDCNLSNYCKNEEGIWLFDYEWTDAGVDKDFLRYRMLHYLYQDNKDLQKRFEHDDFLRKMGFYSDEIYYNYFKEYAFQEKIHGKDIKYIYYENYQQEEIYLRRPYEELKEYQNKISSTQEYVKYLEAEVNKAHSIIKEKDREIQEYQDRIHNIKRGLNNPARVFEKAGRLGSKVISKFNKIDVPEDFETLKEKARRAEEEISEYRDICRGDYKSWIMTKESHGPFDREFSKKPLISVLVPVYNVSNKLLGECIDSVKAQNYENWELILVDDASSLDTVVPFLKAAQASDDRIHCFYKDENSGISDTTNFALSKARGEYIGLLDCDDIITFDALYEVLSIINDHPEADWIYSDEDKISEDGSKRLEPLFKPDFSPDTLMSMMYTSHFTVYRKAFVDMLGGFDSRFDGVQDHDLALRASENTKEIYHIPKVLYHWRISDSSTAADSDAKPYTIWRAIRLKEETLKRRGISGYATRVYGNPLSRVVYEVVGNPLVSIVIPSKDHPDILSRCLSSLYWITGYKNYEVIVVDNGSSPDNKKTYSDIVNSYGYTYIYEPMEFNFSKMCNIGYAQSKGDYILFLNDDTEIISDIWLERMVGAASLSHVGFVGAKLYYPGGELIQHDGVVHVRPGPSHIKEAPIDAFHRNRMDFDVLAVTGACFMTKRSVLEKIGAFDESFPVAYNDVELCLRAIEAGYYNVIRNDAELIHHESISRGDDMMEEDKRLRLAKERERLFNKHPAYDGKDPFYNVNLDGDLITFRPFVDKDYDYYTKKVNPKDYPLGDNSGFLGDVEIISANWKIDIQGFGLFLQNHDYRPMEILLESEKGNAYILGSFRYLRDDVYNAYPHIMYSRFTGFKTKGDRDIVENGVYEIFALHNGKKYSFHKKIGVGQRVE